MAFVDKIRTYCVNTKNKFMKKSFECSKQMQIAYSFCETYLNNNIYVQLNEIWFFALSSDNVKYTNGNGISSNPILPLPGAPL